MEFFKGMKRGLLLMDKYDLLKRINLLEYHQNLLLKLLSNPNLDFYRLIIEKGITEEEVQGS